MKAPCAENWSAFMSCVCDVLVAKGITFLWVLLPKKLDHNLDHNEKFSTR